MNDERQAITGIDIVLILAALLCGGLGGAGIASARAAFGRPVTWALVLAYAAIGAAGAVASLVVDLFGVVAQVVPVRVLDGAPLLARMLTAGVVTALAVALLHGHGARLLRKAGLAVRIERTSSEDGQ
ncbi:hypothetical protein [Plasticicumulans acidivorans]|uniref:Uncharacterized protein n=1 Tax=Plasticicumulans acidivorans TaxID=886464 RepID=A0A317N0C1_9GAMM|nr:hypothetical protein [Plasticicumulans acidivorans]PWV66012.1 hypothetical protein C7443_101500 [Plasticicumulans acidivorans]